MGGYSSTLFHLLYRFSPELRTDFERSVEHRISLKSLRLFHLDNPLEVWPESHWPGFALRQADVFQSYTA